MARFLLSARATTMETIVEEDDGLLGAGEDPYAAIRQLDAERRTATTGVAEKAGTGGVLQVSTRRTFEGGTSAGVDEGRGAPSALERRLPGGWEAGGGRVRVARLFQPPSEGGARELAPLPAEPGEAEKRREGGAAARAPPLRHSLVASVPPVLEAYFQPAGGNVEGVGKILEVSAQYGRLAAATGEMRKVVLTFDLRQIKYGGMELDTNDLTDLFLPGDTVAFSARGVPAPVHLGAPSSEPSPPSLRIFDVARIDEADESESSSRKWVDHSNGVVDYVGAAEGAVRTDKWGVVKFREGSVVLKKAEDRGRSLRELILRGQPVMIRCYSPGPAHTEWEVVSIRPDGQLKAGEGIVTKVAERYAFLKSESYGLVYAPHFAFRFPCKERKTKLLESLLGMRVEFQIVQSSFSKARCAWRAISVKLHRNSWMEARKSQMARSPTVRYPAPRLQPHFSAF